MAVLASLSSNSIEPFANNAVRAVVEPYAPAPQLVARQRTRTARPIEPTQTDEPDEPEETQRPKATKKAATNKTQCEWPHQIRSAASGTTPLR